MPVELLVTFSVLNVQQEAGLIVCDDMTTCDLQQIPSVTMELRR